MLATVRRAPALKSRAVRSTAGKHFDVPCHLVSMADKRHAKEILSVLFLCILWYVVSSSNNVINKMLLNDFPYPTSVTMVQLISITLYSGPFFNLWGVRKFVDMSWKYYFSLIVPLAFGKFFTSFFSHVSMWKVSVSYAHTVKATMPLFTVILSRIILKERQTWKVYFSLIPIIAGVGIATLTELSFDTIGLVAALIATMGFSLQHIYSKKVLHDTGIHHLRLLHILGRLALLMFSPVWLCIDGFHMIREPSLLTKDYTILALLFTDGVLNWLQNIIAFSVLSLVTPLTYAVANASKRIFVISASLFVLGNPVTATNVFGMMLAVFGVLFYNKAKYDAKREATKQTVLPFTQNQWKTKDGYTLLTNVNDYNKNGLQKTSNGYVNGSLSTNGLYTGTSNSKLLFV